MTENLHGTAGAPILAILKANELYNVLVIVTRYFGGILLGTGGLVRAYTGATKKALEDAKYIFKQIGEEVKITIEYSVAEQFKYYCRKNDINMISKNFNLK